MRRALPGQDHEAGAGARCAHMIGLVVLALALSLDAVAISVVRGASAAPGRRLARALEAGLACGIAQALMLLAGWALGSAVLAHISAHDHWIAGGVLGLIGLNMVRAARGQGDAGKVSGPPADPGAHDWTLVLAALATSVDAAAAGLGLELFGAPIWLACVLVGSITAALCASGHWLAAHVGERLGGRAQVLGGMTLVALGLAMALQLGF